MLSLLAAALKVGEIILIVACVAIVIGVVVGVVVRKMKGKPACCDECSGGCSCCQSKKSNDSEQQ